MHHPRGVHPFWRQSKNQGLEKIESHPIRDDLPVNPTLILRHVVWTNQRSINKPTIFHKQNNQGFRIPLFLHRQRFPAKMHGLQHQIKIHRKTDQRLQEVLSLGIKLRRR